MGYETHVVFCCGLVMHFYTHVVHGEQQDNPVVNVMSDNPQSTKSPCLTTVSDRHTQRISDEITFDANKEIRQFAKPSAGTNETVATGRNITFVCRSDVLENSVNVEWYRNYETNKTADVQFFNKKCQLRMQTLPGLYVQQTDCNNGQFKLRIRHVSIRYEADWFCVVIGTTKRHQSQYVALQVQSISVGNGQEVTDSTPQLVGAAASGALVLLAVVATVVGLLTSRRARNTANTGLTSKQSEQDQGSYESVVMVDNLIYSSHDEEDGVNAHPPALLVRSDARCDHVPIF